ncbi:MAG: OmpH family outer membrane protein [Sporomusaceae bacterium]|nr:OmpH family outer membrane protein [Sporomusaceae bacterium]
MKKKLALATLFAISVALLGGCASSTAVGVFDANKAMTESPKIKQFQEQLNTKGKEISDKLEQEKAGISEEEFQKRQEAAYAEFLKGKQDLESQVDASIKQAIEQVATEKKLGVVIYKNATAQGGVDITDAVIQKMQ